MTGVQTCALPIYRSNLDKLVQMEAVMGDLAEAERKKREKRAAEKVEAAEKAAAKAAAAAPVAEAE